MQDDHHFCRWYLPEGFDRQDTLAAAFPGCSSRTQAAHQLDNCSPKQLREVFAAVFGSPTTSNNTAWIRQKLNGALGLGGKQQRATGAAAGCKRSAGPSERGGVRAKQACTNAPSTSPAASHRGGTGAAPRRRRAAARSPSPDWAPSDDHFSLDGWGSEEWGSEEDADNSSAAVAGATTLLAAAAAVESREAAAAAIAAAAAGAGAGGSSLGQRGGGPASGSGMVTRSRLASRPAPESPGGSATGSSLSQPPTEASQEVQLFLQGFLRAAQATLAGMPTATAAARQAAGGLAGAAGAAGRAPIEGQAQVPALPSFLTPQQLGTVKCSAGHSGVAHRRASRMLCTACWRPWLPPPTATLCEQQSHVLPFGPLDLKAHTAASQSSSACVPAQQ